MWNVYIHIGKFWSFIVSHLIWLMFMNTISLSHKPKWEILQDQVVSIQRTSCSLWQRNEKCNYCNSCCDLVRRSDGGCGGRSSGRSPCPAGLRVASRCSCPAPALTLRHWALALRLSTSFPTIVCKAPCHSQSRPSPKLRIRVLSPFQTIRIHLRSSQKISPHKHRGRTPSFI